MINKNFIDDLLEYEVCFFFFIIIFIIIVFNISFNVRLDSIILVLGNFAIAYYIAKKITKLQKTEELKITNCFKELDYLQKLIAELKNEISKKERDLDRIISLIMLQIELIKNYNFISEKSQNKIFAQFIHLEKQLTGENDIDEGYKFSLLQIERSILRIKSEILQ